MKLFNKFDVDSKVLLTLASGVLAIGSAVVSNKTQANERMELKNELKDELMKELLAKKD